MNSTLARSASVAITAILAGAMLSGCGGTVPYGAPTQTVLTTQAAHAQLFGHEHVRYVYTVLPELGAFGINDKNWIIGDADLKGNKTEHARLWINGVITDLGTLGGFNSIAQGNPNAHGIIGGLSQPSIQDPLAEGWGYIFCTASGPCKGHNDLVLGFLWQHGVMTALPTLGGNNAFVFGGVDNQGRMVGVAENGTHDPSCSAPQVLDYEAVVWGPKTGEIQELPPYSGDTVGLAKSINGKGQVVGATGPCAFPSHSMPHAVLWNGHKVVDLGNLGGPTNNVAFAINNNGEIVGQSDLPGDKKTHAFLWKDGKMRDLGTLPGDGSSMAEAINEEGEVVGQSCKRGTSNSGCRAFLWQDGMMTDLNSLVGPSSSLTLTNAEGINDHDQIVGQSYDQSTGNSPGFWAIPTGETAQGKMRASRRVKIFALVAALAVHPSRVGPTVHGDMLGADVCVTYNLTQSGVARAFINAGVTTTRFPGGCQDDYWHWRTGTDGPGRCSRSANPNSTWRNFVNDVALPADLNVSLGVNYGSDKTCTGGGDPTEAAAWVSAAPSRHWWTVGNEQYYSGNPGANALDLHRPAAGQTSCPGNPVCYAYYEQAFYKDMHAAATQNINVCIDGFPQQHSGAWDAVVLANALYDCSEIHFYPEIEGQGNDDTLLQNGAGLFDAFLKTEQAHLATAGRPNVPLFVAEVNRQSNTPGPESIVEGLFAANVVATAMDDGVARLTWHSTFADCNYPVPNQPNVYPSWLPWGTSGMFSGKNSNCSRMQPPLGTLLAVGNSFLVLSSYVHPGEHTLRTTKTGDVEVAGYAETYGTGYQVLLINRRRTSSENVTVSIDGKTSGSGGQIVYYDKATFDQTQHGIYAGPTYDSLAPWSGSFTVTLTPWSVTSIRVN